MANNTTSLAPAASAVIAALQMTDSQRKWLEFRERIHDLRAEIEEQAARDFAGADLTSINEAVLTISGVLWELYGDVLQDDILLARKSLETKESPRR